MCDRHPCAGIKCRNPHCAAPLATESDLELAAAHRDPEWLRAPSVSGVCAPSAPESLPFVTKEEQSEAFLAWLAMQPKPDPKDHDFRDDTSEDDTCSVCGESRDSHEPSALESARAEVEALKKEAADCAENHYAAEEGRALEAEVKALKAKVAEVTAERDRMAEGRSKSFQRVAAAESSARAMRAAIVLVLDTIPPPDERPQWGVDDYRNAIRLARERLADFAPFTSAPKVKP